MIDPVFLLFSFPVLPVHLACVFLSSSSLSFPFLSFHHDHSRHQVLLIAPGQSLMQNYLDNIAPLQEELNGWVCAKQEGEDKGMDMLVSCSCGG